MISPTLFTRMKKLHLLFAERVTGSRFVIFMTVAALACQREIIKSGGPSLAAWDAVVEGEGVSGILCWTVTILTAAFCTSCNEVSKRSSIKCRHWRMVEDR